LLRKLERAAGLNKREGETYPSTMIAVTRCALK
jgi:hypothetical protein